MIVCVYADFHWEYVLKLDNIWIYQGVFMTNGKNAQNCQISVDLDIQSAVLQKYYSPDLSWVYSRTYRFCHTGISIV